MTISTDVIDQISVLNKLENWVQHPNNVKIIGAHISSTKQKIRGAIFMAEQIQHSLKDKPTIGVFGPSQAGKSYLTAKFAEDDSGKLIINLGQEYDFLQDINPEGGRESTALVSRFTSDSVLGNAEFPIKAELLSEADIVCILANSYLRDNKNPVYPDVEKISQIIEKFEKYSTDVYNEKDSDLFRLEHYISNKVMPKEIADRFLPLWTNIRLVGRAQKPSERLQAFGLFWNNNKKFDNLYLKLTETLAQIRGQAQINLRLSSLIPRESSIIDVSILAELDKNDTKKELILCDHTEYELEKPVLSALISELFLPIRQPKSKFFEVADLLDFPGARTRFTKEISDQDDVGVHEFFLRGKIDYLFQKFTMDLRLDALVFCVDPGPLNVKELPDTLEDWLLSNKYVGQTAANNLFFTLTQFDRHFPDAAGNKNDVSLRFENAVDAGLIQPFVRNDKSWPVCWGDKSFNNVFPVRNPNYPLHGFFEYKDGKEIAKIEGQTQRLFQLKNAFLESPLVKKHVDDAENKWNDLIGINRGGADNLLAQIQLLDLRQLKTENLRYQMVRNAKSVFDMLSMFVHSDDDSHRLSAELDKFDELYEEIYSIGETGCFSKFLVELGVSQQFTFSCLSSNINNTNQINISVNPAKTSWRPEILRDREPSKIESDETINQNNNLITSRSTNILTNWIKNLTKSVESGRLAVDLNTSSEALNFLISHMSNEKQINAIKKKLDERLENWTFGLMQDSNLAPISKIACDEINNHLLLKNWHTDIVESVFDDPIVNFSSVKLETHIDRWHTWLDDFAKIIQENCSNTGDMNFDRQQNDRLVECLSELIPTS